MARQFMSSEFSKVFLNMIYKYKSNKKRSEKRSEKQYMQQYVSYWFISNGAPNF